MIRVNLPTLAHLQGHISKFDSELKNIETNVSFTPQMLAENWIIWTIKSLSMSIPPDTAGKLYMILQDVRDLPF